MASALRQALGPIRDRLKKQCEEATKLNKTPEPEISDQLPAFKTMKTKLLQYNSTYQQKYNEWVSLSKGDEQEMKKVKENLEDHQVLTMDVDEAIIAMTILIEMVETKEAKKEKRAIEEKELEIKQRLWAERAPKNPTAPAAATAVVSEVTPVANVPTAVTAVKLPKLEAVKFDGNVLNWRPFWDSFESSIDKHPGLSAVDKMNYLKAQLIGEAANSIAGLSATSDNYPAAISILKQRFGNSDVIIDSHYTALSDLAPAQNQKELRPVFDKIEQHINSLSALGEDVNHRNFLSMLKSKLSASVLVQLERDRGEDVWDAKELRGRIRRFLTICESAYNRPSATSQSSTAAKGGSHSFKSTGPPRSTTASLLTHTPARRCAFCTSNEHWSTDCSVFPTAAARRQKLGGNCPNCLQSGHSLGNCVRKKGCYYCRKIKDHHSSLCPQQYPAASPVPTATMVTTDPPIIINSTSAISTLEGNVNTFLASGNTVFLQTATITLRNPDGTKFAKIRALLDCGSQKSYISDKLAKDLGLQPRSVENLSVGTFMDQSKKEILSPVVNAFIKLADHSLFRITANVVPVITGGIQRAPMTFKDLRPLFRAFEMADTIPEASETVPIDLLIGNDFYDDIMTTERVSLMKGLYLKGSKLGWILSGRMLPDSMVSNQRNTSTMLNFVISSDTVPVSGSHEETNPFSSDGSPSVLDQVPPIPSSAPPPQSLPLPPEGSSMVEKKGNVSKLKPRYGNALGIAHSCGWVTVSFLWILLAAWVLQAGALNPLICGGEEAKLSIDLSMTHTCVHRSVSGTEPHKRATAKLYKRNIAQTSTTARKCSKVKSIKRAYTNFAKLGWDHEDEQQNLAVTEAECQLMMERYRCSEGILHGNEEFAYTENTVDYPYSTGNAWDCCKYIEASTTNCFRVKGKVFSTFGGKMESNLGSVGHCEYEKGACILNNMEVLIWKPDNEATCEYVLWRELTGYSRPGKFVSDDRAFALTWDPSTKADTPVCKNRFATLTDQEIPVRIKELQNRRQRDTDGWSATDSIAPQLQALDDRISEFINEQLASQFLWACRTMAEMQEMDLIYANQEPTLVARRLLQDNLIMARLNGKIMDIWPCVPVDHYMTLPMTDRCYTSIPLNFTVKGQTHYGFYDPKTQIIFQNAEPMDCKLAEELHIHDENGSVLIYKASTGSIFPFHGTLLSHPLYAFNFTRFADFREIIHKPIALYSQEEVKGQVSLNDFYDAVDKHERLLQELSRNGPSKSQSEDVKRLLDGINQWTPWGWISLQFQRIKDAWVYFCCALTTVVFLWHLWTHFTPGCIRHPVQRVVITGYNKIRAYTPGDQQVPQATAGRYFSPSPTNGN